MGAGASVDGSQDGLVSLALSAEMTKPLDGSDLSTGAEATTAFAAKSEVARLRRLLADRIELGTGKVQLNYQMCDEKFDIVDGRMAVEYLDDEYALSFAMPGCKLELITYTPSRKRAGEQSEDRPGAVREKRNGTQFVGMTRSPSTGSSSTRTRSSTSETWKVRAQ